MSDVEDFYAILELTPSAEATAIERAWRRESFRWHPDRNPDDQDAAHARFLLVDEARRVLGDPQARARYDRQWARVYGAHGTSPPPPRPDPKPTEAPTGPRAPSARMDDLVTEMMRERTARQRARATPKEIERDVQRMMDRLAGVRPPTSGSARLICWILGLLTAASLGVSYLILAAGAASGHAPESVIAMEAAAPPTIMLWIFVRTALRWRSYYRATKPFRATAERLVKARP